MAKFMAAARGVAVYRWAVLVLAVAVWATCFAEARMEEFGWQFRHLDVWALTVSLVSAAAMVRLSMGWSGSRHEALAGAAAALNALVIAVHLIPMLGGDVLGGGAPTWRSTYLHLIGPMLQIADAMLILGAFGRLSVVLAGAAALAASYVAWIELAVRPLNARDGVGGLPYAGLDALEPGARLAVYAAALAAALAAVPVMRAAQGALRPVAVRATLG